MRVSTLGRRSAIVGAGLLAAVTLAATAPSSATSTRAATYSMEKVDGFLQGYPGNCPPAEAPQEPLVCHEDILSAYKVSSSEGPGGVSPSKSSWELDVVRHKLSFPGGGADPSESDVVTGSSASPQVTFDQQHLSGGRVVATGIAMTDGSTLDVDATWTATSARIQSGNNGPSLADFGEVRHLHGRCVNEINQGHQKFRLAHVHALLNGVPADDLGTFAFIAYNQFISIEVHPHSCA
jgi:hypothetical protein